MRKSIKLRPGELIKRISFSDRTEYEVRYTSDGTAQVEHVVDEAAATRRLKDLSEQGHLVVLQVGKYVADRTHCTATVTILGSVRRIRNVVHIEAPIADMQRERQLEQLYVPTAKEFDISKWERVPERGVIAIEATCPITD